MAFRIWGWRYEHCFAMDIDEQGDIFWPGILIPEQEIGMVGQLELNNTGDMVLEQKSGNPV